MPKKQKQYFWSGCEKCKILQKRNEEKSNENWSVFDCNHPCPKCGEIMTLVWGEPPADAIQESEV
jgi:hypothetical protein